MKSKLIIVLFALLSCATVWGQSCNGCSTAGCASVSLSVVYQGQTIYTNANVPWVNNMNVTTALYNAQSTQPSLLFISTQYCPYGSFVTSINGNAQQGSSYWALYVNGVFAQFGIDLQKVNPKDKIGLVYTKYSDAPVAKNTKAHQTHYFAALENKK